MTKQREREFLINEYITKFRDFASLNMKFLDLENLALNMSEKADLEEIARLIGYGIGAIEKAWENIYAFKLRIEEEENLKHDHGKSW